MKKRVKRLISAWRLGVWFYANGENGPVNFYEPLVIIYTPKTRDDAAKVLCNFSTDNIPRFLRQSAVNSEEAIRAFTQIEEIINGDTKD